MKSATGTLLLAGALFLTQSTFAEDSKNASAASDASEGSPTAVASGKTVPRMVVTVDRETGRLRPATAKERAALAASGRKVLGRTGEATAVEVRPDGSLHARLGPEFFRWSVARANPDGSLSYDGAPAKKVPAGASPAALSEREK
jgi:hypothetical protein